MNLTENLGDGDKQVKENSEKEIDFLKKINDYQRNNFILGCVISFLLGFILPLAFIVIKFVCMGDGNIPVYYFDRLKIAWQIGILKMSISGAIICGMYIIINLLLRKTKK